MMIDPHEYNRKVIEKIQIHELELIEYMDISELGWAVGECFPDKQICVTFIFPNCMKLYTLLPPPFHRYAITHDGIIFDYRNLRYAGDNQALFNQVNKLHFMDRKEIVDTTRAPNSRVVEQVALRDVYGRVKHFIVPDLLGHAYLQNPFNKTTTAFLDVIQPFELVAGAPISRVHIQNLIWYD